MLSHYLTDREGRAGPWCDVRARRVPVCSSYHPDSLPCIKSPTLPHTRDNDVIVAVPARASTSSLSIEHTVPFTCHSSARRYVFSGQLWPPMSKVLYQGPRTCQCLVSLFKHLGLSGPSIQMLCVDTDTAGLQELLLHGNAGSTPAWRLVYFITSSSSSVIHKLICAPSVRASDMIWNAILDGTVRKFATCLQISTTSPHDYAPAPASVVEKYAASGFIAPLADCEHSCHWRGWCSRRSDGGDASPPQLRCECYADLSDDPHNACKARPVADGLIQCPAHCSHRCDAPTQFTSTAWPPLICLRCAASATACLASA